MFFQAPDAEPLISWIDVAQEYVGFLAAWFTIGAIGFQHVVLPRSAVTTIQGFPSRTASLRAARIGFLGAILGVVAFVWKLQLTATERHTTFTDAFTRGGAGNMIALIALAVMIIAFGLAAAGNLSLFPVAAIATLCFALRAIVRLQFRALVNPLHIVAGSLWLGTLFVMLVAGVALALSTETSSEARGPAVTRMVRAYSSLALVSVALLVAMGLTTAWTHLKRIDALWTTPYGYTLITKLCLVAVILALGAYHWRTAGPALDDEPSAQTFSRTARTEIVLGFIVLVITAVLVVLPSPR
jgi:putative copper export protein